MSTAQINLFKKQKTDYQVGFYRYNTLTRIFLIFTRNNTFTSGI